MKKEKKATTIAVERAIECLSNIHAIHPKKGKNSRNKKRENQKEGKSAK